jgi:hypothetical protein
MPLEEENYVYRNVRESHVTDAAADFEPLWAQWADQLG